MLNIIQAPNSYTQTLTYNASNQLATVTDSYGRTLISPMPLAVCCRRLALPTAGRSPTVTPRYPAPKISPRSLIQPPSKQQYLCLRKPQSHQYSYGVIDEAGNRYATWTYDAYGRALTSSLGGSLAANLTTVAYNDIDGSRTVTNALGATDTYTVASLQSVPKVAQISRAATSTTAAATRTFTYDANGFYGEFHRLGRQCHDLYA